MQRFAHIQGRLVIFVAALIFVFLIPELYRLPRPSVSTEMQVALPRFAQVLMAGGDRFLAANIAGFRALVVSTENMEQDNYKILGIVQSDLSWFNPAHEDNYYIATAILPWYGEIAATQYILRRASEARPMDFLPAFHYAFNLMHFEKKPSAGAEWLFEASRHTKDELEKIQLQQMAALWVAKGEDPALAVRLHRAMAKDSKSHGFAVFLEKRAQRLENQMQLDAALAGYRNVYGKAPERLLELVGTGLLREMPADPFGAEYVIGSDGHAGVAQRQSSRLERK